MRFIVRSIGIDKSWTYFQYQNMKYFKTYQINLINFQKRMESNRELIENLVKYTFSFKPANAPRTNLSETYEQIKESQVTGEKISTWLDLVKRYCPQVLKFYPQEKYRKQYSQEVHLIDAELKFKDSTKPGLKYTLIKSKHEVEKFAKKWYKKNGQEISSNRIHELLTNFFFQNEKQKLAFHDFIEQVAPHDKCIFRHNKGNIRVLGQYRVSLAESISGKSCMDNTICRPCQQFNKDFLTFTNENILLSDEQLINGIVVQAIPYTYALNIRYLLDKAQTFGHRFAIRLKSGTTKFSVIFEDFFDLLKFSYTFGLVKKSMPYFDSLRFESFSPQRQHNWTKFYNDGKDYFSDLYDQIQTAKHKICITGWCITPYLLLKRPQSIENGEARLDRTLGRAAKRGVKIFILVFQEPSLFVNNDSFNVWQIFENMDQNFKVLRHPGLIIPQLWSHHEKMVVIDEQIGFMGGLDICYGRWDTHDHAIYDKDSLWQGADYNNERQRSITQPRNFTKSNLDRENEPRMPWHDIAIQLKGPSVIDMQRHFVHYWYFAIRDISNDPKDHLLNFKTRYEELIRQEKIKRGGEENREQAEKQRQNLFGKSKLTSEEEEILMMTYAQAKKNDVNDLTFADRVRSAKHAFKDLVMNNTKTTSKQIIVEGFGVNQKKGNMNLQLCRSSCTWSTGIKTVEHSIYNAYLDLIMRAKEFIYIENQFFMSHENFISQKIAERIRLAYTNKQKFKVIVMMPLLPGFEGDVTKQTSGVLRVQMQIQYEAISRHKSSIFQLVQDLPININDYITFFGVRNHGLFGKNKDIPKTEIIYVHSKLMIVDDRYMIIGSANINDRSLLGSRDSELAMVIEDPDGGYGKGSIFEFRCRIFDEHFGMSERNCKDLNGYWKKMNEIARTNTEIYRQVFGCYPDNTAVKFADVDRLQREANPSLYWKKIGNLYGHYVEWPIYFLKEQNLSLKFGQKQFLAPLTFFT